MSEASEVKPPGAPVVTPVRVVIALCLFAPFVAMLWVGSYAKTDPAFIGIPFFYWYQMAWVLISTALTGAAYVLWQRDQRARKAQRSQDGGVAK
ncbi:DUF3311 domain-containing protein [Streptomyces ipomoeae]|uniref:DUF3311 domain-containing protein n=1 Tax=Streptomyces ipomoeae TaxID=103232 RepID=UPI0015F0BF43|nr:DUF3311 domain-containing protein [Streptomyces ipomoeae]MDX2693275.1 DUF3311 domain-containing protein [Streptomyces ipomoeae]MDX2820685.1 DUF3311 domain-containing protein [Streptomyces ipomoeae]MDX2838768.1 DUF3311 domain-containing protein [Streptomyces ipomoeae]MDX2873192.1 DUF3311 domain-containing protein [Streptomyces ipomoeae]MDX2934187.1 DUF3311 domain-containing protein [Streptomyces ipomoeae]